MTAALNKIQLIGNIGADPKAITTKDGSFFVTASLATNESVKRNGKWESMVEWHLLIFFGSMTKITEHLRKGSQIYLEGRLRSNSWTDSAGSPHRTINIVVTSVQLLGYRTKEAETTELVSTSAEVHLAQMRDMLEASSEEIPF